jgi:hypothetical protein
MRNRVFIKTSFPVLKWMESLLNLLALPLRSSGPDPAMNGRFVAVSYPFRINLQRIQKFSKSFPGGC